MIKGKMKGRFIILSLMLLLGTGMASAQNTAYTYVKQYNITDYYTKGTNGVVSDDGTAAFAVSETAPAVMKFDDNNNAIMTIGDVTVAKLTSEEVSFGGVLTSDFDNQSGAETTGSLPVTVKKTNNGYGTISSPFLLQMPTSTSVDVYAPKYDTSDHLLKCISGTNGNKISVSTEDDKVILPIGTTLFLNSNTTADDVVITFDMVTTEANDTHTSAFNGSAVYRSLPERETGMNIYTLGHKKNDADNTFGFFHYVGTCIYPAKAWLIASELDSKDAEIPSVNGAKYIGINFFEDNTDAIENVNADVRNNCEGKYIENGKVVIIKKGQKFNLIGQEVK